MKPTTWTDNGTRLRVTAYCPDKKVMVRTDYRYGGRKTREQAVFKARCLSPELDFVAVTEVLRESPVKVPAWLSAIDVHSRKAFIVPMSSSNSKRRTGGQIMAAMETVTKEMGDVPQNINADQEFNRQPMLEWYKKHNIEMAMLIDTYNETRHGTTGRTPDQMWDGATSQQRVTTKGGATATTFEYKIGQRVRTLAKKRPYGGDASQATWSNREYVIESIAGNRITLHTLSGETLGQTYAPYQLKFSSDAAVAPEDTRADKNAEAREAADTRRKGKAVGARMLAKSGVGDKEMTLHKQLRLVRGRMRAALDQLMGGTWDVVYDGRRREIFVGTAETLLEAACGPQCVSVYAIRRPGPRQLHSLDVVYHMNHELFSSTAELFGQSSQLFLDTSAVNAGGVVARLFNTGVGPGQLAGSFALPLMGCLGDMQQYMPSIAEVTVELTVADILGRKIIDLIPATPSLPTEFSITEMSLVVNVVKFNDPSYYAQIASAPVSIRTSTTLYNSSPLATGTTGIVDINLLSRAMSAKRLMYRFSSTLNAATGIYSSSNPNSRIADAH
ncbi:hypothetical protein B484DRAFT_394710 [Ochromonadaceae sp. CCMP2298]|nr:hypothetical protein B484DRAFT_394710 [Ochromonadaceae sp. CCMP2298]